MKYYWTLCAGLMLWLATTPVAAFEDSDFNPENRMTIELRRHPTPEPYTFQDYLSDSAESTRISDIDPQNPVRQLEARKDQKYEPLNPIVFRW